MTIKQLSVFVENRSGRICEITRVLAENGIDIRALSIADTTDFGILRLIVNNPEKAFSALKAAGMTVTITNVIAIGMEDKPGSLSSVLTHLYGHDISVEYMYAFLDRTENSAYVIIRVDDPEKALEVLKKNHITILEQNEICS